MPASNPPPAKRAKTEPKGIKIGDSIPNVTLKDQSGNEHALSAVEGILVLFAYPKASTPGCTKQTKGFGENFDEFKKLNATVFGISADSEKSQTTFKNKLDLPFDLLSDPKYELLGPLGAKKTAKGGVIRSHWVFKDGICTLVEHSVKPDQSPVITLDQAKTDAGDANDEGSAAEESNDASIATKTEAKGEAKDEPAGESEEPKKEISETTANGDKITATVNSDKLDENPEKADEIASNAIAQVVSKISQSGDVDPENVKVSVDGKEEPSKLEEAREDDRAEAREAEKSDKDATEEAEPKKVEA